MKWWQVFDKFNFRIVAGDGFSVKIHDGPGGSVVRYVEGGRELTLLLTSDQIDPKRRDFLFFPAAVITLRVPASLTWDGGVSLTQGEALIAVDRIRSAVQHKLDRYRVVIDDDFYQRQQLDLDNLKK